MSPSLSSKKSGLLVGRTMVWGVGAQAESAKAAINTRLNRRVRCAFFIVVSPFCESCIGLSIFKSAFSY